jgi:hypothetical protein
MMSSSDGGTKHGPLSLQMGAVTGAVDDLVHGYEQLVHTLPSLSGKIAHMHSNTENMANELGVRNSNLNMLPFHLYMIPPVLTSKSRIGS